MSFSSFCWSLRVFIRRLRNTAVILVNAPFVYRNWPYFFYSRFCKGEGVLEMRSGLKIRLRNRGADRSAVSEMFILDSYDQSGEFAIRPQDTVIDVGANIGAFTIVAARAASSGRVYAVEPSSANFVLLNENVRLNQLENVKTLNLALSASDGSAVLHFGGECPSLHFESGVETETVATRSLESLLNAEGLSRVDLLKLDCEGAEFDILLNASENALSRVHKIVMEYHNVSLEKNHKVLAEFLRRHGFEVTVSEGGWNGGISAIRRS